MYTPPPSVLSPKLNYLIYGQPSSVMIKTKWIFIDANPAAVEEGALGSQSVDP